jgi:hypothetical protein
MRCVGNVGSRQFLQKVELADDAPIVEMVVERWRLFIALENFSGGCWSIIVNLNTTKSHMTMTLISESPYM